VQGSIRLFAFWFATILLENLYGGEVALGDAALPRVTDPPAETASAEQVVRLVEALRSDRYQERKSALDGLDRAVRLPRSIDRVYAALKKSAADPTLPLDARVSLGPLLETARNTWLWHSAGESSEPPSVESIAHWINEVVRAGDSTPALKSGRRSAAEWELLDALAQPASAAAVRQAVERALTSDELDDDAARRLQRLQEWSQPALASEYWQRRRNLAIQYFVLGVSSKVAGAMRATRFDRVADNMVHCTSGNALEPGHYPINVAFPHPREQAAFFQLVSLPTARDRLIYHYECERLDEQARLRAITERTLGRSLVNKRPLDEGQMWLLGQLDQLTVARLMAAHFAEVTDEPFDLSQLAPMLTDVSSTHRAACMMLALDGSHEVIPTLVAAAEQKQFLKLSTDEPQAVPWIAALAIAGREPWEETDLWLAGLLERTDGIAFGPGAPGEVGATAAAMLLKRNGEHPQQFGLAVREPVRRGLHDRFEAPVNAEYRRRMYEDRMFKQLGVIPHYFADPAGRAAVGTWWQRRQAARGAAPAAAATTPGIAVNVAKP
jgi:hypothetical protein